MKQHFVMKRGLSYKLASDLDHCYCPVCNHRAVAVCEKEKCKCCVVSKTRLQAWERELKRDGDWKLE